MSCQSWWCGGPPVPLARVPAGTRVLLPCGCAVQPREGAAPAADTSHARIAVTVLSARCEAHQSGPPVAYPPDTLVQVDLLASLIDDPQRR